MHLLLDVEVCPDLPWTIAGALERFAGGFVVPTQVEAWLFGVAPVRGAKDGN